MKFLDHLTTVFQTFRSWMITNKLKINDSKTEFLLITSPRSKFTKDIQITIGQSNIGPSSTCKSLGVMLDDHFAIFAHISNICRSTYFHIVTNEEVNFPFLYFLHIIMANSFHFKS